MTTTGIDNNNGDRRVRRTKALLQQGLIQLMETKEIQDISVKELSDLIDINRGTFYLHYNDIYDLLKSMENQLFVEFNEILDRTMTCESPSSERIFQEVFSFLERHKDFAKVMMGPHGDLTFVNRLKDLVKERIYNLLNFKQISHSHEYVESFIVSGCIGIIETWLHHPAPKSPAEMTVICSDLLTQGLGLL